ncbi:MAG: LOG family protein [Anaerolineae bacterium]|nr:LOG family protein [Anaerolineae bacterium]
MRQAGIVSVLGGSAPAPGSPAYQEAYTLGRLLAEAGYTVASGGYSGTMEAVSRGAAEAGGHVIGVTTDRLNRWEARTIHPNPWVREEIRFPTLRERLIHLITFSDALIALRGGIGTLSEVSLAWSLMQVGEIAVRPLILVGESWGALLRQFYGNGEYIRDKDMRLWQCVDGPAAAVAVLNGHTEADKEQDHA